MHYSSPKQEKYMKERCQDIIKNKQQTWIWERENLGLYPKSVSPRPPKSVS